jgi:hypothetical protein
MTASATPENYTTLTDVTRKIDEPVDLAQQVIVRDMALEAEAVEQRLLHHPPFAHHGASPRFTVKSESAARHRGKRLFQQNRPEVEVSAARDDRWLTNPERKFRATCRLAPRDSLPTFLRLAILPYRAFLP